MINMHSRVRNKVRITRRKPFLLFSSPAAFTLIELIQVIVIIGIIAAIAIPKFINYREEARGARDSGVYGALRSALSIYYAQYGTYPRDWPTLRDRVIWSPPELAYEYKWYTCTTAGCLPNPP